MYQTQWFANKNVFKWLEVGPMGRDKKISNKTKKKKTLYGQHSYLKIVLRIR